MGCGEGVREGGRGRGERERGRQEREERGDREQERRGRREIGGLKGKEREDGEVFRGQRQAGREGFVALCLSGC